jgi:2-polyprenyl-6-methoxyphenol hydroxylase-like FAD-dependent oxidoreductase
MRAVICGAGIAGLTQAWWLGRSGWDITMIDVAPRLRDEGYMIDFFGPGYDTAEVMGLMPALRNVAYEVPDVRWVRPDGSLACRIDYARFSRFQGGPLLSLMRPDLEHVLAGAVLDHCDVRFGVTIDAVTVRDDGVDVRYTDGTTQQADLLIGADGIHSRVRDLIFGQQARYLRHLGYHTAAHLLRDDELHGRLDGSFQIVRTAGRQAGCYPLRDGRVAAFYAHATDERTLPDDPRSALREVYADMGPTIERVLARCPAPQHVYYDQVAQIEMPAWHHQRVVLVGDACGAVSLLAGQGASMAIAGTAVLADELRRTAGVEAALTAYEARVRPVVEAKQVAGRATAKWFLPSTRATLAVRDLMIRIADHSWTDVLLRPTLTSPGGGLAVAPPQETSSTSLPRT